MTKVSDEGGMVPAAAYRQDAELYRVVSGGILLLLKAHQMLPAGLFLVWMVEKGFELL